MSLPTITDARPGTALTRTGGGLGQHIPAIDGLRAVAVLGVVAFHLNALPGGFLGVDLFFVISGFVITRAILSQRQGGVFRLGRFWLSRVKRLLPAVLVVLIAVEVWLAVVGPAGLERVTDIQALSSLVYGTNWFDIVWDFGYADASQEMSPLNHLWSLAIEEQFYLLWPALLLLLRRRWMIVAVTTASVVVGLLYGLVVSQLWTFDRLYQGTDIRMVALLGGAMVAAFPAGGGPSLGSRGVSRALARVAPWTALASAAALMWLWVSLPLGKDVFGGPLAIAVVLEIVLVASLAASSSRLLGSVLSWGPLVFVGRRSYALYLWHWPVIVIVSETYTGWTGWDLATARVVAMVLLTLLSYALVENPIRRAKSPGPWLWTGLVAAMAAVVALASLPGAAWSQPTGNGRAQESGASGLPLIEPGKKVLVVGDSWAAALAEGMTDPEFGTTVQNLGKGGCGIADVQAYMNNDESVVPPPAQCLTWRTDWTSALRTDRPDAVVLTTGNYDQRKAQIDGKWVYVGDPAFDSRYSKHLDEAISLFTNAGIPVFLTNTVVLNGEPFHAHSMAMNRLLKAAAERHPGATLIDYGGYLCHAEETANCPRVRDGQPIYDATGHLADFWQNRAAHFVLSEMQKQLAAPDHG